MAASKKTEPVVEEPQDKVETVDTDKGNTRLVSPLGQETSVPESIVDSLIESGYTKA